VSFHEPHCVNYRLFVTSAADRDNPLAIKIERVDSMAESVDLTRLAEDEDADSVSAQSVRIADNRSAKSGLESINMIDREYCTWVNDLLAVFYEAWTDAKVFHDLVLNGIYNAVNDGRDPSLAEIKCKALSLEGKPPRIVWVRNASVKKDGTDRPCFKIEGDAVVPGKVKILISTAYKINWPAYNWTSIDLELFIIVSRISGRVRFQYSNDMEHHGGSYLQFLGRPAVKVQVEPVIFKKSQIALNSIPTVKKLIDDIVVDVIEGLCSPSRVEMSVPCVLESIALDESGRRIPVRKPEAATTAKKTETN